MASLFMNNFIVALASWGVWEREGEEENITEWVGRMGVNGRGKKEQKDGGRGSPGHVPDDDRITEP